MSLCPYVWKTYFRCNFIIEARSSLKFHPNPLILPLFSPKGWKFCKGGILSSLPLIFKKKIWGWGKSSRPWTILPFLYISPGKQHLCTHRNEILMFLIHLDLILPVPTSPDKQEIMVNFNAI